MNETTFNLVLAIITFIAMLITRYFIPYLKEKLENTRFANLMENIESAVKTAEQLAHNGMVDKEDKKEFVVNFIKKNCKGKLTHITDEQLDVLIEATVNTLFGKNTTT